jgi:hypothetical protein
MPVVECVGSDRSGGKHCDALRRQKIEKIEDSSMTAHDHEIVSIYGFSEQQINDLMTKLKGGSIVHWQKK